MAVALQAASFVQQYINSWRYAVPKKSDNPLNLGVLSTARINASAIIFPAQTHPDVVLHAIASRDAQAAESQARKYKFKKFYDTYEGLLADPDIHFVYISTPNSLHFEWAYKALEAGKHVLLEKPFAANADEARKLTAKARETGKILMEAFHWQFHPVAHVFRQILQSGDYGQILMTSAWMTATPAIPASDIRWKFDLAGGSLMDMTYVLSFTRFALEAGPPEKEYSAIACTSAADEKVDSAMKATLVFKTPEGYEVVSDIYTDMARPWYMGAVPRLWELPSIRVETNTHTVYFYNAMMPHVYHYIAITNKASGRTSYEKHYAGGPKWGSRGQPYWSTYRYQLEAFVDKLKGREPAHWVTNEESVKQMMSIDAVYQKSGLPLRPSASAM